MSSELFRIDEHIVDASHIRGFPRSTSTTQEEVLQLSVKQYTPLDNTNPKPGDLTIIAAHANGFPKVKYASSCTTSNDWFCPSIFLDKRAYLSS
jgi:hypothetical protein